jgi:pyruvate dehydrogenase E2 component (dihydrolipoamide acetyltransferase)
MSLIEIKVPDIGDFSDVAVIEVLVKAGDSVRAEQSLLTVESDKASMEIPSSHAGVVKELKVALGDKVSQGSLVLLLEVTGEAATTAPVTSAAPLASASTNPDQVPVQTAAAPVVAVSAVPSTGPVELRVPDIGDFKDVVVIEVMVKVGDAVKAEQSLITVESDKASMEIPASAAGVIGSLLVKLGDKVNQGDLLARLVGAADTRDAGAATGASSVAEDLVSKVAPALISQSNLAIVEVANAGPRSACSPAGWHGAGLAPRLAIGAQVCAPTGCAVERGQRLRSQGPHQ